MPFAQQYKGQDERFLQETYTLLGEMRDTHISIRKIWLADWESQLVNWKYNIEMYLKTKRYTDTDWILEAVDNFSWQTVVTTVMNK